MARSDKSMQAGGTGMVLIRLFLGVFFIYDGITHLFRQPAFMASITNATAPNGSILHSGGVGSTLAPLMTILNANASMASWIFIFGGIFVGLLLLIGLFTRFAAFLALCISVFFGLSSFSTTNAMAELGAQPIYILYAALIVMELATLISAAGRSWGVDALLARKSKIGILW